MGKYHFVILCLSDGKWGREGGGGSCFSPDAMEGLLLLCAAEMGRIAAVEIPFCERTIYNLAIDLFMCLHRLSLDATGHV